MHVVAVVHPTSLLAKELRERLEARSDLCRELRLLSLDEEEIGAVTESAGAAAFVGRLEPDSLAGVDLAFFCGDIAREPFGAIDAQRLHPRQPALPADPAWHVRNP